MSRQVEIESSRTLGMMQDYLDAIRQGDHAQSFVLAMGWVERGDCPVEWVRDALVESLRGQAAQFRQIAATPNYRYTEGRSAGYYGGKADRFEAFADHIETGEEFTFQQMHVPPTAELLERKQEEERAKELEKLRDNPSAAFADKRGRRLHFSVVEKGWPGQSFVQESQDSSLANKAL